MVSLIAAGVIAIAPYLMDKIIAWGHRIPQRHIDSDYLKGLIWAVFLGVSIVWWPVRAEDKPALIWIWSLKAAVTLGAMLLYESHYQLDAYGYFKASRGLESGIVATGGTHNMVLLVQLHHLLFFDSYHAIKVTFSLVGLISVYIFYRAACLFIRHEDVRILWILALTPSIIFWSSILGKDPINLLGYALYGYGVVAWKRKHKARYLGLLGVGVAIGATIRLWTAAIMFIPLMLIALREARRGVQLVIVGLAGIAFVVLYHQLLAYFRAAGVSALLETLQNKEARFGSAGGSATGQVLHISGLGDVVRMAPLAVPNALFRPLPGEVMNPFGLMAGLEDLALLLLGIRATLRVTGAELANPVIQWGLALICVWAAVYGVFWFGNFGALVRFRLQILPVVILLLLYLGRANKIAVLSEW
jgi:hypothetical protein